MQEHMFTSGYSEADLPMDEAIDGAVDLDREALAKELSGRYQIVRLLGRGATGLVYLARDLALHRVVAIKSLRWDLASSDDERERFRREARTSAQLSHPNIIPLHTFGESPDVIYMVMRYIAGESLAERLRHARRVSAEETRHILAELALGLEYAHRQGVVHRDLKPENILLEGDEARPILADFGVAMQPTRDTGPNELRRSFGTPHFMSPEQAAGEFDIDGRSDIYALGILGYLMLSGELPVDGDNAVHIAARQMAHDHVPLALVAPDAPSDLVDIIERCLEKEPEDRWRHARDLHAALVARRGPLSRVWHRLRALPSQLTRWRRRTTLRLPGSGPRLAEVAGRL